MFSKYLTFSGKTAFLQISPDFVAGFEKSFFIWKFFRQGWWKYMKIIFFCSSSGSEDLREKHKFQNQLDMFFCYSLQGAIVSWTHTSKSAYYFVDALRCVRAADQNMAANNHPLTHCISCIGCFILKGIVGKNSNDIVICPIYKYRSNIFCKVYQFYKETACKASNCFCVLTNTSFVGLIWN